MRYLALATDYDGTIAHHGVVDGQTLASLEQLKKSGRKLILVTGRRLDDLKSVCPQWEIFDWIVAENGALLCRPALREERVLAEAPGERFVKELGKRGVDSIDVGRVIVATWEPHELTVLEVIRDLGLELQVIFNKGAVMVLPASVNKATGLAAALAEMGLSPHNVVGVGDAENDHAFLRFCECSAAVANALPVVKQTADFVTRGDHGAGVQELIDELITSDLSQCDDRLSRHYVLLGNSRTGAEHKLDPCRTRLLIAGPSASGKSTVATSLMEQLSDQNYQYCVIDPEGDYQTLIGAKTIGSSDRAPVVDEIVQLLNNPSENVVVNLIGMPLKERPKFFLALAPRLEELRARTGRPHWLVVDEAHHLLPSDWQPVATQLPLTWSPIVFITVHAELVAPSVLNPVNSVVAVGDEPQRTLGDFCSILGSSLPEISTSDGEPGEVVFWQRPGRPVRIRVKPSRTERRRHRRKYAQGELPPERSFYFRGPEDKLKLRARNLFSFLELSEGVDDETWLYHLRCGDYSRWFLEMIKDPELSASTQSIEQQTGLSPAESRCLIRKAIERDYTLPADSDASGDVAIAP
jgi:hydroxymethylpyrimidine pyrophosphatase-like HAD family hydrolase